MGANVFVSPLFWALLIATAAVCQLLPARSVRARAVLLTAASLISLAAVVHLSLVSMAIVVGSVGWILYGLHRLGGAAPRRPLLAALSIVGPILGAWAVGKEALALDLPHLTGLFFVGLSFFLVKAWTLVKDVCDGRFPPPDPWMVACYLLCFPLYVSGPMHLYAEFERCLREPARLDGEAFVDVVYRLSLGFAKVKFLAALLLPVSLEGYRAAGQIGPRDLSVACIAYSIVIWADFSGFSDIAIACGKLLGIETPENFQWPYAARNIREFWQRWHVTFSRVLTSYVFVPLSRVLVRPLPRSRRTVMIVTTLATFLLCGFWHGPTRGFLLWGAYHAVGLIAFDLYNGSALRRALQRRRPASLLASRIGQGASIAATFAFVSLGWALFVLPLDLLLRGWP